jgi:hypothetical protein
MYWTIPLMVSCALLGIGAIVIEPAKDTSAAAAEQAAAKYKQCPDCTETVLEAAQVCKHCGYRFKTASA